MSDVIILCDIHGKLDVAATIKIKSSGHVTCRKCRHNQMKRKYQKENPEYYNGYHQANKEKVKKRMASYNQRPDVKAKNKILSRKKSQKRKLAQYGMNQDDYHNLLNIQNGLCAICFNEETSYDSRLKLTKQLAIDHNHFTGENRGLLCCRCNLILVRVNEDITILKSMINYLNKNDI